MLCCQNRPELFNHFNSSAPGYDPANAENVEWTGWSSATALDISWLNWGSQMRMAPAQNIHAPRVKQATKRALTVAGKVVAQWWEAAPLADRKLLIGIKIGCEAGIGWQVWAYAGANSIFQRHPHNSSFDPKTGGNHSAPPEPPTFGHSQQIGFAAATSSGLTTSGALTNAHVQTLTHWYLRNMTDVVTAAGVPTSVLFTHYGGTLIPKGGIAGVDGLAPTMAYAGGELPGIALGVSLYVTPLDEVPSFAHGAAVREEGWGAVEFGLPNFDAPAGVQPGSEAAWLAGMNRTLQLTGCRLLAQVPLSAAAVAAATHLIAVAGREREQ